MSDLRFEVRRSDLQRMADDFMFAFYAQQYGDGCPTAEDMCCVCLEDGGVWWSSTVCPHRLHMVCAGQWIRHQARCPVCGAAFPGSH